MSLTIGLLLRLLLVSTAGTGLHFDLSVYMHPMLVPNESGILVSVSYAPLGEE